MVGAATLDPGSSSSQVNESCGLLFTNGLPSGLARKKNNKKNQTNASLIVSGRGHKNKTTFALESREKSELNAVGGDL